MKCTSCTTAGSNGEVFFAFLVALFFVCSCYRMLETSRVCGVSCDGNVNALFPHDRNTFRNAVSAVAVNLCTKSLRIGFTEYFLNLVLIWIILCLYICKAVDTGDDLSSIFSKTVQDNTKRFFTNLVCFLSDTDRTLSCCERLMSCKEAEAVCLFLKKHLSKVSMSKTYFTCVCNGSRDTESLKAFSDSCCCVSGSSAAFFDRDSCTYCVSPASVLEADRLNAFDLIVNVQSCVFSDFLSFFDRSDSIAV